MQPQESSFLIGVAQHQTKIMIFNRSIAEVEDELIEVEADQEVENDLQLSDELSSMPHEARRF